MAETRRADTLARVEDSILVPSTSKAFLPQPRPGTVFVLEAHLTDNGDGDRWADTNETVQMRVTVYNAMRLDLTNITLQLRTASDTVTCIVDDTAHIAALAAEETRTLEDSFSFLVGDVHRSDVAQELTAAFWIEMTADQFAALPEPESVILDLDLDASGGSQSTVFFEGFENGFGQFTEMHLDANLNPPNSDLGNSAAGLLNADGYRCQYSDPDWEGSNVFYSSSAETCYPNADGAVDRFFFSNSLDRSYSGSRSLYYGVELNLGQGFTTPLAQLEAVVTTDPVFLGWNNVCEATRSTFCSTALGCPLGEACVRAAPQLRFKHQISLLDHRAVQADLFESVDRAVVQIQAVASDGSAAGPWQTLHGYRNRHETRHTVKFRNCFFDPVDDGNTEVDFFDPADPSRLLGPSSTCNPEWTFAHQGDTDDPFDATNIGDADGPGLEGESGLGTWVESAFSLWRFAGRSVRLRFLVSTVKIRESTTWDAAGGSNPAPEDDGWWIDDVTVSDTLIEGASIAVDGNPNDDIKDDADLDGIGAVCDCDPTDGTVWMVSGEVADLTLSHAGGASGTTVLSWTEPTAPGALSVVYDTLRSASPDDFAGSATCVESSGSERESIDTFVPAPGATSYFLVRARHGCGPGSLGTSSSGVPRTAPECS